MSTGGRINEEDFRRMFGMKPSEFHEPLLKRLHDMDTSWRVPSKDELEAHLLDYLKLIHETIRRRTPEENQNAFESGWRENLDAVISAGATADALRPRYFRENKFLRYHKSMIVSDNLDLEHDLFTIAREILFTKYLSPYSNIYEFGCGSCSNLLALSDLFPDKQLWGLDWTRISVDIGNVLASRHGRRIQTGLFDFLEPHPDFRLEPDSAVLTVHALEQIGEQHRPWIDILLAQRPALVVNYEPILEFYDSANVWDYLALLYCRKRGYLSNYYTSLQELAKSGKIEIVDAFRPQLGGVYHEASVVVWRPI
jgi:hypothetical protein